MKSGEHDDETVSESEEIDGETLVQRLLVASILVEDEAVDDLRLTDEFERVWRRRIERVREGDRAIQHMAMLLEADPDDLSVDQDEGKTVAKLRGSKTGRWPSEAAFVADVALHPIFGEWLPMWEELDGDARDELLARLRAFLETCPACDGTLAVEQERDPETGAETVSLTCEECGQVTLSRSHR